MAALGLYIHIPFCLRKCAYCDFVSFPGRETDIDRYIDALIAEARLYEPLLRRKRIDSVFIGGGTPSLLSAAQMEKLFHGLQAVQIWQDAEVTAEANPETLSFEKIKGYASCGINRLSIGLQTHEDAVLCDIGRNHSWQTFVDAYEYAAQIFSNINIDVIFGLPGQSIRSFQETLCRIIDIAPKHISAYALKLESGTPLAKRFEGADEDIDREMYHDAVRMLEAAAYTHYETSNFAQKGFECRHNLKYWTGESYLGMGVAAFSYISDNGGCRFGNVQSLDDYFGCIEDGKRPVLEEQFLSEDDVMIEYIMLRLRLNHGIDFNDYKAHFGGNFEANFEKSIDMAKKAGLITVEPERIRPTLKGFDMQNSLIGLFINKL